MKLSRFLAIATVLSSFSVTGCVNLSTATVDPSTNVLVLKTMYVQQSGTDQRGVAGLIADKLRTKGVKVSIGTDQQPKGNVDALVTYKDVWVWDFTTYLADLTILMKNPTTEQIVAHGNSRHGSLTRLSPTEMVSEVVDNIYKSSSDDAGNAATPSVATPSPAQGEQQPTNVQKLQKLKSLLDQGLITKAEYMQKKKAILDQN